jgi:hypothetical protein
LTLHPDPLQLPHPSVRGPARLRSQLLSDFQFGNHEPSITQVHAA